jgi:streptogrisin C
VVRGGRTLAVLPFVVAALLAHSPSASSSELLEVQLLSAQEESLLQAVNHARAVHGAPQLRIGVRLQSAARTHSRTMVRTGAFTHGDWYRRLRRHGVRARTVGETIAWGAGTHGTAASLVRMWLASPPHRATLLRRGFRRIGVGVAIGTMDGLPGATVATADFAG